MRGVSGSSNPDVSQVVGVAGKLTSQLKQGAALTTGRAPATSTGRLLGVDRDLWGSEVTMPHVDTVDRDLWGSEVTMPPVDTVDRDLWGSEVTMPPCYVCTCTSEG